MLVVNSRMAEYSLYEPKLLPAKINKISPTHNRLQDSKEDSRQAQVGS